MADTFSRPREMESPGPYSAQRTPIIISRISRTSGSSLGHISEVSNSPSGFGPEDEDFEAFRPKVLALCRTIWPDISPELFQIEHVGGGSFNQIIGITIDDKGDTPFLDEDRTRKFIIRIPRSWWARTSWAEHEVAIITYLKAHTQLPVPEIIKYDLTSKNKIGSRYTVQYWIQGKSAQEVYPTLNQAQKLHFAKKLGSAIREMSLVSLPTAGFLDPESIIEKTDLPTTMEFNVPPRSSIHYQFFSDPVPMESRSPKEPYLDVIRTLFSRQYQEDIKNSREAGSPWPTFIKIVEHMADLGLFQDQNYYLTHIDFEPRNMMIHIQDEQTATLSGILDWDGALFAPAFLNCRSPQWLWDWRDGEDEDETKANDVPTDAQNWEIKHAFESVVGHPYLLYAYSPVYQLARRMLMHGILGVSSNEGFRECDEIVQRWNEMYPMLSVQPQDVLMTTKCDNEVTSPPTGASDLFSEQVADQESGHHKTKGGKAKEVVREFLQHISGVFRKK